MPFHRNSKTDWAKVFELAKKDKIEEIALSDPSVVVQHYSSLKKIATDYLPRIHRPGVQVFVYWGITGSGKTHRAFEEAGDLDGVFVKDPNTKWWDGYRNESNVIIDEFTGLISINHLLRWLDKYSCPVESKGKSSALYATKFWITSNINPDEWYNNNPHVTQSQKEALRRRFTRVVHYDLPFRN